MSLPEYVVINGKQVKVSSLPPAIRNSIVKAQTSPTGFLGSGSSANIKTSDPLRLKGLYDIMNDASRKPRERIRAREILINSGVKGTSLHLGGATPEVIKQLEFSRDNQKFSEKKIPIQNTITQKIKEGIVLGNSSTRPAKTKEVAERTFAIQQDFTKAKSQEVRDLLDSPEFIQLKQQGTQGGTVNTLEAYNQLLNSKGIAVPKFEAEIVNELAQADIIGETQTAQNINRILEQAGFGSVSTQVSLTPSGAGQLSGLQTNEALNGFQEQVNDIVVGSSAFGSGGGASDVRFTDLPSLAGLPAIEEEGGQGSIFDILLNPFVLLGVGAVILLLVFAGGKP